MPPHEETDRSISYSMMAPVSVDGPDGKPVTDVVASTTTLVLVRGKVLFLYCYADEAGLGWTREASKAWAAVILTENPAEVAGWFEGTVGLAGGASGVVGGLAAMVYLRRKKAMGGVRP